MTKKSVRKANARIADVAIAAGLAKMTPAKQRAKLRAREATMKYMRQSEAKAKAAKARAYLKKVSMSTER